MSRLLMLSSLFGLGMSATCDYGISFATIPAPFLDGVCQKTDLALVGETTSLMFSCEDSMFSAWNYTAECEGDADYTFPADFSACDTGSTTCDSIDASLAFTVGDDCSATNIGTGTFSILVGEWCEDASAVLGLGYAGITVNADELVVNIYFDDACAGTVYLGQTYANGECINENGTSILPTYTYNDGSGGSSGDDDAACSISGMAAFAIASIAAIFALQ